ncbi:ABC transporter [Christiangramia fulva]|uniref:ABC transporter n=1 Tax=Christiangramia fulva TaxID=2126553 RepID=A0A2R3Z560_9FLAO|nr:ATP-binding cassette domain-containing protein [Christiangramia fulva]AVR45417.1 ABC transporter [Christiangramia fulva]
MAPQNFHYGLAGAYGTSKKGLIADLLHGKLPEDLKFLDHKKIGYFSDEFLDRFIEEDSRHGSSGLSANRSIRTFSTGEKRKALLQYLIAEKNDVLILDNPFDALDQESVRELKARFFELHDEISVIQLIKREEDLLPFIEKIIQVRQDQILIIDRENFNFQHIENNGNSASIPAPLKRYRNIPQELIRLENVSVNYEGRPILNKINWSVQKGEFWELRGPNGSGKTTLLDMIYGDNPKAYGQEIYLFGNRKGSGESVWEIKDKIGYFSPAMTELFKGNYSLCEMVLGGLFDSIGLYRTASEIQKQLAEKWLQALELSDKKKLKFYKASRLEQRMVLIARAMIKHPPLLILDEPAVGLDDESARMLVNLINKIASESETAIIFVSHRKEKGLSAQKTYRLIPSANGSEGVEESV